MAVSPLEILIFGPPKPDFFAPAASPDFGQISRKQGGGGEPEGGGEPSRYPLIVYKVYQSGFALSAPKFLTFIRSSVHPLKRSSVHPFIQNFNSSVHPFIRSSKWFDSSVHPFIRSSICLTQAFIRSSISDAIMFVKKLFKSLYFQLNFNKMQRLPPL